MINKSIFVFVFIVIAFCLTNCNQETSIDFDVQSTSHNETTHDNDTQMILEESTDTFIDEFDETQQYTMHELTFPVNENEKTEFNAAIYEINPFKLKFDLPKGWTLKEREKLEDDNSLYYLNICVWSIIDIYNSDNKYIGAVGYNTYVEYEDADDNPNMIYNQISIGNGYRFNINDVYDKVSQSETGCTVLTEVYYSEAFMVGKNIGNTEKINKGILSYNSDLFVYIAIEFDNSALNGNQLNVIAESIIIE